MSVSLVLDLQGAAPPYEQLRTQLAGHIRAGALAPGEKLPVVRALAADLGVATNTVARAYRELEANGLVTTRRRVGTIVCIPATVVDPGLHRQAGALVRAARAAGLDDGAVLDLLQGALSAEA